MSHLLMYINWFYLQVVIRVFLAFLACICSDTGASIGADIISNMEQFKFLSYSLNSLEGLKRGANIIILFSFLTDATTR